MNIDSHQHFWIVDKFDYPWMSPGLGVLYRDYLPADLAPLLRKSGIDRTIVVQASPSVAETDWLLELAAQNEFIAGVVGWLDLEAPDFTRQFHQYRKKPKFVGLRPAVEFIPDHRWLVRPRVVESLRVIESAHFPIDLIVWPRHLPSVVTMLEKVPHLRCVVDHLAKSDGSESWRDGMREIAGYPAACCKLSGLPTANRMEVQPWVDHVLDCFGPEPRNVWERLADFDARRKLRTISQPDSRTRIERPRIETTWRNSRPVLSTPLNEYIGMNDYLSRSFGLRGRRVLVTGASRGIGRAVAEALASAGSDVCVHYNKSRDAAEEVVCSIRKHGGNAWSARADLTNTRAIGGLFQKIKRRWGALDILVNNAGDMITRRTLADSDDKLIDRLLRVNLHSTLYATRAAIPLLRRGTVPVIINTSSVSAHNGGGGGVTVYAAAKGAIHTFTRGLAKELAPRIRVNAIAPGVILTDLHRKLSTKQKLRRFAQSTPLQRIGQPEDCASAVVFLAGAGASFITGEVIEINGGLWVA